MSEQNQRGEELFEKLSKDKKRRRNKIIRTVVIIIAVVAVILVAAVIILRKNVEERFANAAAEVQEYAVKTGTIHTIVTGSGILTEEDLEAIDVPAGVEITEMIAEAGDTVSKGDLLATVNMATVMTSLSSLQEQLDTLDDAISDAKGDEVSSYIRAGVSGRVKRIFAEKGMDVSLCMAENGALAVLSLDGYMAADLQTEEVKAGDTVTVFREDGSSFSGTVDSAAGGRATILVTDNGPRFDEEVTVSTTEGKELGKTKLYIHSPLAVTGYAGTISSISAQENTKVDPYTTVFQLKNTSFSASYDNMLRNRSDLEEELMDLLTIYRDGAVLAPMDGMISAVHYSVEGETTATASASTTSSASASAYASYYSAYTGAAAASTTTSAAASSGTGTSLYSLYPDLAMTISISIDETDILSLEEGQEAEVTVSSVSSDEIFLGLVTDISKVADTSTGVTQYSAEVTLDKAYGMLPGMTADVDIKIQGVENALIVPVDSLHQTRDTWFVYTTYDPETNQYGGRKDVTVGMRNDKEAEILEGLAEGEKIYYTEAPQNIFAAMAAMAGMGGMGGMGGAPMRRGG